MVAETSALAALIGRHDRDLERQLRRSSTSVPLNIAESLGSRGKNANARRDDARGSALEAYATLEVAAAAGYLSPHRAKSALSKLDYIRGSLYRMNRG
ncbi:MAG: four helix bundle protein [Myxococcota bacterium]